MDTDIIVIGAGPAGLSFCRSLKDSGLQIIALEKSGLDDLENPPPDGREIALTHVSKSILTDLGVWEWLDESEKYFLREAKVVDGNSPYTLHFPTPEKALGQPTDTLGYLISNHDIRKAPYAQVESMENLTIRPECVARKVSSNDALASVELENGDTVTAKLIVAADSRHSQSRSQMGIGAEMNDFGRTVVVFRMQHSLSNESAATECFHYGRTLAVLPLSENMSSIVVTIDSSRAGEIQSLTADELAADIVRQLDGGLGSMELVGGVYSYPLVGVHARRFYGKRFALIGDAAVGMHPVTAHGFNLGLKSQKILADLVCRAAENREDIGNTALLSRYSRKHMANTLPLYHGTNLIVKLFTTETGPAKFARKLALHAGNTFLPFKALVSRQLTG